MNEAPLDVATVSDAPVNDAGSKVRRVVAMLLFAYLLAGFVGWIYEVFICGPLNGEGVNLLHGGLGIPFLVIYAIGAILIEAAFGLGRPQRHPLVQLLQATLLCTALEYGAGLLMLHVVGVQTWDYRMPGWDFLCTPDGLICLRASLTFGLLGLFLLRCASPWFMRRYEQNSKVAFAVVLVLALVTVAALLNAYVFHFFDAGGGWQ